MSQTLLQARRKRPTRRCRPRRVLSGALLGIGLAVAGTGHALAATHLQRAEALLAKGDLANAKIELRNALRRHDDAGHAAYLLGRLDLETGDPVSAERNAREAMKSGYEPGPSLTLLLNALLAQHRYVDLLHKYKLDGATGERGARIALARASADLALSRRREAQQDLQKAAQLDPNLPELWLTRESGDLARHDLAAARKALDQAAKAGADPDEIALRRAQLLLAEQKPKQAAQALSALLAKSPGFFPARLAYADALAAAGESDKARSQVHAVMKVVPNSATALYLLAALDVQSHDWKGAQSTLQKLQPVMAQIPAAYLLQAQTDAGLGLNAASVTAARHYVSQEPGDPRGHIELARFALANHQPDVALKTLSPGAWPKGVKLDAGALLLRGEAARQTGALAAAHADFAKAVAMAPHDVTALANLGLTELSQNHPKAAVDALRRAAAEPNASPNVQRLLAEAAIKAGDPKTAQAAIDAYQKHAGADAAAPLRAEFDLTQGDLDGARKTLSLLHQDKPDSTAAVLGLARLDLIEGKPDAARSLLQTAAARHPANRQILATLVSLQLAAHDEAAARKTLQAAHQAAPKDAGIVGDLVQLDLARKHVDAAATLLNGLPPDMASDPAILLASARLALAQKHPDVAQAKLQSLLHAKPGASQVRIALAKLDVSMKQADAARDVLDQGLARSPHDATLMQARVGLALHQGGLAAAQAEARKLADDPTHQPEAASLPGDLLLSRHKPKEAAAAYAAADKAGPSPALAFDQARALLAAGEQSQAEAVLKAGAAKYPKAAGFPLLLGQLALNRNDLSQAASLYRQALDLQPNDVVALNNLAWVEQQLGKPDAIQLAERAFTLSPSAQTADTLGWIQFKSRGAGHGIALLASAHQRAPKDPDIAYHYATALSAAGHDQEAADVLKPVLKAKRQNFRDRAAAEALYGRITKGS